jgi:peptidyl-prolyl cis-trans isomerase SurA
LGAEVVNRDDIRIRDLPGPLQDVMLALQVGQSTPPYGDLNDGVRVFVMCGKDTPTQATEESFDQIMSRLEDERVNKRARIYLRDLRRDAIIEYS